MKKCKVCGEDYEPRNTLQKVCSPKCAISLVEQAKRTEIKRSARRAKREMNGNDKRYMTKKAQAAFNRFIRLRDKDLPCISCGRHHQGQYHAGHYKTTGAHPELRFDELNCNKQCAPCNNHKSGDITNYRKNLIEKIGLEKVEWLEGPHETKKWTIDDLKYIADLYREKANGLELESQKEDI